MQQLGRGENIHESCIFQITDLPNHSLERDAQKTARPSS